MCEKKPDTGELSCFLARSPGALDTRWEAEGLSTVVSQSVHSELDWSTRGPSSGSMEAKPQV